MPTSRKGSEGFSEDADGRKDHHIHEPILNGIEPEAHQVVVGIGKEHARKLGLSEAQLEKLYGAKK